MSQKASNKRTPAAILKELEAIEQYFQAGQLDLDEAIAKHAQAVTLAKELEAILKKSEDAFERIAASEMTGKAGDENA